MRTWGTLVVALLAAATRADAMCEWSPPRRVVLKVTACQQVTPEQSKGLMRWAAEYPRQYVESARAEAAARAEKTVAGYRGVVVVAKAWENGCTPASDYFAVPSVAKECSTFAAGRKLTATIEHACGDGDPGAPCYIGLDRKIVKVVPYRTKTPMPTRE